MSAVLSNQYVRKYTEKCTAYFESDEKKAKVGMVAGGILLFVGPLLCSYAGVGSFALISATAAGAGIFVISTYYHLKHSHRIENHDLTLSGAIYQGNKDAVEHLLSIDGINLQERTMDGQTLLHLAATYANGKTDILGDLVEMGLEVNATDIKGQTPLHKAAEAGDHVAFLELVKRKGDPLIKARDERTPLDMFTQQVQTFIISQLQTVAPELFKLSGQSS